MSLLHVLQLASPGAIAITVSFLVFRGAYYAFFHPLAKIPGPKLYAATSLPYYLHLLRGDWHNTLKDMHDRYGPAVRFTPNDVSFITTDAFKQIYGHKSSLEATFMKDPPFYKRGLKHSTIINANHEDHKRFRRLLSHAFSEKALRSQEDILTLYVDKFINRLAEHTHKKASIDLVSWYNFATFDVIGDLSFGESFGCLDSGGYHPWVRLVFQHVKSIPIRQIAQSLDFGFLIPYVTPKHLIKASKEHLELSRETAMRRVASTTDRADFISYILRYNDEKGMSMGEIAANSHVLILAGSETTATLLSGTTFQLLTNKAKYDKLVNEIRSSFDTEDSITLEGVNQLPYLLAVLNEGLRIYPPVPTGLPRLVPVGGETLEGYYVPEKATFHSESNFRDAEDFVPERWLGDHRYDNDSKTVLQPFSMGPRNCIGKNLAYAEMRLILARLLWNFDVELLDESKTWDKQKSFLLYEKGPLYVSLTKITQDGDRPSTTA
ncbi:hypothetical protein FDECE_11759 [Fusarium decemcellulare]|nr:hypothetical protein FDECE_11759 [Fusarium decemcellulare]